jgi:uncharacterized protein YfiM (DUF2279 family)
MTARRTLPLLLCLLAAASAQPAPTVHLWDDRYETSGVVLDDYLSAGAEAAACRAALAWTEAEAAALGAAVTQERAAHESRSALLLSALRAEGEARDACDLRADLAGTRAAALEAERDRERERAERARRAARRWRAAAVTLAGTTATTGALLYVLTR